MVRTPKSPSPGGTFSDQRCVWTYGRNTECRIIQEKYRGRGASSRGFFQRNRRNSIFFVGGATKKVHLVAIAKMWSDCSSHGIETPAESNDFSSVKEATNRASQKADKAS